MNIKNKQFINKLITFSMIIIFYIIVVCMQKTGNISSLFNGLLVPFCTYSIIAIALNIVVGISGELSLGHAGFMCVGAFASATFTRYMQYQDINGLHIFIIAIIIGAISAALVGFVIGIPVLRLKGDYLAIVTLAFGEIIKNIVNAIYLGFDSKGLHFSLKNQLSLGLEKGGKVLIKGPQGIVGTPQYSTFTIGIVLLLITVFVAYNLIYQRTGRAIMAIRDNRIAAESIGLKTLKYKMIAFIISAAFAGVAGVLYAHNLNTLTALPKNFGYNMSITILVFVVLGGIGNIRGSIIAAVVLNYLPEVLRNLQDKRMLIYAIVLIAVMICTNAPVAKNNISIIMNRLGIKKEKQNG